MRLKPRRHSDRATYVHTVATEVYRDDDTWYLVQYVSTYNMLATPGATDLMISTNTLF